MPAIDHPKAINPTGPMGWGPDLMGERSPQPPEANVRGFLVLVSGFGRLWFLDSWVLRFQGSNFVQLWACPRFCVQQQRNSTPKSGFRVKSCGEEERKKRKTMKRRKKKQEK